MVTFEIYTITGGELIKAFYNAVAGLFQSAGLIGLFKTALLIGGVWTAGQFIIKRDIRHFFFFIIKYALVMAFILTPVCRLQIQDRTNPLEDLSVDHVPLLLGVVGGVSSQLSDRLTRLLELFFHAPNDLDYSQTGMIMGAKLFLSASGIKITDAHFNATMQQFMQQCVFYDLMYGRYSLKQLNEAPDIWSLVKAETSIAQGIIDQGEFKSCAATAALLDSQWQAVIQDAKSKYAGFAFGNHVDALAQFEKYLPQTYQHLTTLSADAAAIIRQNMMANAIRDGVYAIGARHNVKAAIDSFSASRAQEKIPAALNNLGLMAAYWLPIIHSALFCLTIGGFLFVVFFLPFPTGISVLQFYTTIYVWLALWPPMFTLINYLMTSLSSFSLSFAKSANTTLAYQSGVNLIYENMAAVGGYLSLATMTLSYLFISRRMEGLMGAAQLVGGVVQQGAASAAEEVQLGNYSYGNTSFANHHQFNHQSFHHDQNARVSVGNVETTLEGGSLARVARNDSETLTMTPGMSQTPLSIHLGESTRHAFAELSDNAMNTAYSQSAAAVEQYGASLRSLVELGESAAHSAQSGEGYQLSNSAGFNQAASTVANSVNQFADDHNVSQDDALRTLSAASVSANGSVGIGGNLLGFIRGRLGVSANARHEHDKIHASHDAELFNQAQRFSQEHHFNDVVSTAKQATEDVNFRVSDDYNARLTDNFSTGYERAHHYREEAAASFNQSASYHQQATAAKEQTTNINWDAQSEFVEWLAHHRAPNSAGHIGLQQAEWLMRHEPALMDHYAKQFVQEKTAQSVRAFQQQHPINLDSVQQNHSAFKDKLGEEDRVNQTLQDYLAEFNQQAHSVNLSQVNPAAQAAVQQELHEVNKIVHQQTVAIDEEGSTLKQTINQDNPMKRE